MQLRLLEILVATCLLSACSSLSPSVPLQAQDAAPHDCANWFQRLDAQIEQSAARDAEAHRLSGYPHLRSDRLLASFADDVAGDSAKFHDWLNAMRDLDQRSREMEIRNLPATAARALGVADKAIMSAETLRCGNVLLAADRRSPEAPLRLKTLSRVPDSYSLGLRALGLYPLVSIPFLGGVTQWQQRTVAEFERQRTMPFDASSAIRYVPSAATYGFDDPRTLPARVIRNALGIPQFSDAQREALLSAYAPIFEISTDRDDDRIGTLVWRQDRILAVETAQPTAYRRVAFTRFGNRVLTQLVYTVWFPRRTFSAIFDPVAGEFDGVVFRLTLDDDGWPLIADSIHACGCYHEFFPSSRATPRPAPESHIEWAFAPAPLPPLSAGERFSLRLAAGTHYITRIQTSEAAAGAHYLAADEDSLRSLMLSGDETRSVYGPDGLIAGSERTERFLFWPMGIASAGSMRQWGRHATAFVGRRHFDDAELFDKRFALTSE